MVLKWQHITRIITMITVGYITLSHTEATAHPEDWKQIETVAEQHPYVVALLNNLTDYVCTGTIINKRAILTSGNCIAHNPKYVVVGAAIYGKNYNNNHSIFEVAFTRVHEDYTFELKSPVPNVTKMHSNIGLVVVKFPVLELFITAADIGNYYASELQNKKIKAVGYGKNGNSDAVGLQYQVYRQSPCANPKWYYCICGVESKNTLRTYKHEFGQGSPIVYGSEVVGIAAVPCGTLSLKTFKYDIFTVIGPYLQWIEKSQQNTTTVIMHPKSKGLSLQSNLNSKCGYVIFIVVSKVFN